jgi:predicted nucleic acid-binding protein
VSLVLDTGVLLAFGDKSDPENPRCLELINKARARRQLLAIPALVLCELSYMLEQMGRRDVVATFVGDIIAGGYRLELPTSEDLQRALDIDAMFRVGLTDATVAALAERTQSPIATLDRRHFTKLRTARGRPFKLVP